jgi:hypothetical protein
MLTVVLLQDFVATQEAQISLRRKDLSDKRFVVRFAESVEAKSIESKTR